MSDYTSMQYGGWLCLTSNEACDAAELHGSDRIRGWIRGDWIQARMDIGLDRPNYETQRYVICESLVQHTFYVLRPELTHVLKMSITGDTANHD